MGMSTSGYVATAGEEEDEAEVIQYMWWNQNALWAWDFVWVCIFIGRYSYFSARWWGGKKSCLLSVSFPWPINIPHLLSWQLAPRFCPSLPARSPEKPGLRQLGDKLPISPAEHLWGWALLQSSSSTWGEERPGKLEEKRVSEGSTPLVVRNCFKSLRLDVEWC